MLRIKKDVPLEKLEKYGFAICKCPSYTNDYYYVQSVSKYYNLIVVEIETRQIKMYFEDEYYDCCFLKNNLELLFDLIQDGLVEKVEEED